MTLAPESGNHDTIYALTSDRPQTRACGQVQMWDGNAWANVGTIMTWELEKSPKRTTTQPSDCVDAEQSLTPVEFTLHTDFATGWYRICNPTTECSNAVRLT